MHGSRVLKRLEYPKRATRSRRCALKVRIASAGNHPRSACICGQQALHAFQPVLLPLMQLLYLPNLYYKLCDEETACGQCLSSWCHPSWLCDGAAVAGGGLLRPPDVSPVRVTRSN